MTKEKTSFLDVIVALLLAFLVFFTSGILANKVESSSLLTHSRVLKGLLEEDTVDIWSIVSQTGKREGAVKFISALADAYVAFELIPHKEGQTLMHIMNSMNDDIEIESFSYSGRDLTIKGKSATLGGYEDFVEKLDSSSYFIMVEESYLEEKDSEVFFVVTGYRNSLSSYQDFFPMNNAKIDNTAD